MLFGGAPAWGCLKRPFSPLAAKKMFSFFNSNKKLQSNFLLELKKENIFLAARGEDGLLRQARIRILP